MPFFNVLDETLNAVISSLFIVHHFHTFMFFLVHPQNKMFIEVRYLTINHVLLFDRMGGSMVGGRTNLTVRLLLCPPSP